MAWWDEALDAVGSAVGWVGDAVEAGVDTATEVAEEAIDSATDVVDAGLDALRDGAAAISPGLGWIANVGLGIVKGAVHAITDVLGIDIDFLRNLGKLVSDIFHLDLAGFIADLGNIAINFGQIVVWAIRVLTGAYFGKEVSDYFMRDRAVTFIRTLIIGEFGKQEGEDILRKLGSGSTHFGLPITASARIMCADSDTFPFLDLQGQGLDLFSLAGLLSFNSFRIDRERTRVVRVDDSGNDMWWPIDRGAIRSFLNSGGTSMRIRAYAMHPYAAGKAMRTAFRKFKKLCIDLSWDTPFNFPTFRQFNTQPCVNEREFSFFADSTVDAALWFAVNTPRDGQPDQDGIPLGIGIFGFENGQRGLTIGRDIKRHVDGTGGCAPDSSDDACISVITRQAHDFGSLDINNDGVDDLPDDPCCCGCTWRDVYPPFLSRLVLAHELGHYFGLARAGHDGVHNIMVSLPEGNAPLSEGSWRLWMNGDASFVEEDVEHAWRFIVKKMPHVLRAL
jgi:hypothetical protein